MSDHKNLSLNELCATVSKQFFAPYKVMCESLVGDDQSLKATFKVIVPYTLAGEFDSQAAYDYLVSLRMFTEVNLSVDYAYPDAIFDYTN